MQFSPTQSWIYARPKESRALRRNGATATRASTRIDHRSVGPDLKASGPKNRTFDFMPDARVTDFDDSKWEIIPPDSLEKRRGNGRLSLNWYRLTVTIPEKVGGFDTKGSTAVFEIVVDDYAEVSVNLEAEDGIGRLKHRFRDKIAHFHWLLKPTLPLQERALSLHRC